MGRLRLIELGTLNWTTTIDDVFGGDFTVDPDFVDVTVEMLLAHRSGLSRNPVNFGDPNRFGVAIPNRMVARAALAAHAFSQPPDEIPGSVYLYSNQGYMLVAAILEKLTGTAWEDLIVQHLFTPLNMGRCTFVNDPQVNMEGHRLVKGVLTERTPSEQIAEYSPMRYPGGGVACPQIDLDRYMQAQIDGFHGLSNAVTAATYTKLHAPYPG